MEDTTHYGQPYFRLDHYERPAQQLEFSVHVAMIWIESQTLHKLIFRTATEMAFSNFSADPL